MQFLHGECSFALGATHPDFGIEGHQDGGDIRRMGDGTDIKFYRQADGLQGYIHCRRQLVVMPVFVAELSGLAGIESSGLGKGKTDSHNDAAVDLSSYTVFLLWPD